MNDFLLLLLLFGVTKRHTEKADFQKEISDSTRIMNRLPFRPLSLLGKTTSRYNASSGITDRGLASRAQTVDKKKLPLAGVKVLDMSRVLAGVCFFLFLSL